LKSKKPLPLDWYLESFLDLEASFLL